MPRLGSDSSEDPDGNAYERALARRYGTRFDRYGDHSEEFKPGMTARIPQCECRTCSALDADRSIYSSPRHSDYDNIIPSKRSELTDHQYLVCASHMYAFVLKDRTYGKCNGS